MPSLSFFLFLSVGTRSPARDPREVLAAHALALLMESPSPSDASSPAASSLESGEEGEPSTAPRVAREALVVEEISDSEDEEERRGLLRALLSETD